MVFVRDHVLGVVCIKLVVWEPFFRLMVGEMEEVLCSEAPHLKTFLCFWRKENDLIVFFSWCCVQMAEYIRPLFVVWVNISQNLTSISL